MNKKTFFELFLTSQQGDSWQTIWEGAKVFETKTTTTFTDLNNFVNLNVKKIRITGTLSLTRDTSYSDIQNAAFRSGENLYIAASAAEPTINQEIENEVTNFAYSVMYLNGSYYSGTNSINRTISLSYSTVSGKFVFSQAGTTSKGNAKFTLKKIEIQQ